MSKKIYLKDCQEVAKGRGGECLSIEYINNHVKMKWKCKFGHKWEAIFGNIKAGHWCPFCGGTARLTIEECKQHAKFKDGECLSEKYFNNNIKMKWKCKFGHEWKSDFFHIKAGCWCPYCASKKAKQTNLKKYGVENPMQNKKIKEKMKQTNLKKYGVGYPLQNLEIKKKAKQTNLQKYGCEHSSQNEEVREKSKQTCLERYGVEHPAQSSKVYQKTKITGNRIKKYIAPRGNIFHCQGYEPLALQILFKELKYNENNIITLCKGQKMISYYFLDEKHYYNPDIIILSEHKIIEVKSDYTFETFYYKNMSKALACIDQGWKYEFWVFIKGELIIFKLQK